MLTYEIKNETLHLSKNKKFADFLENRTKDLKLISEHLTDIQLEQTMRKLINYNDWLSYADRHISADILYNLIQKGFYGEAFFAIALCSKGQKNKSGKKPDIFKREREVVKTILNEWKTTALANIAE